MNDEITLTKSAFVRLFDDVFDEPTYPSPNDDSGSGRRVDYAIPDRLLQQLLDRIHVHPDPSPFAYLQRAAFINPQPLPPGISMAFTPRRRVALARSFARAQIRQLVTQFDAAEMVVGPQQSERLLQTAQQRVSEFVDWYCGNGRIPLWVKLIGDGIEPPHGKPWNPGAPVEQLGTGVEFQLAAAAESPLREVFATAADKLFAAATKGLEYGERARESA